MVTDLVILGLLNRARRHGYDLKKEIEVGMQNVDIKYGSIYHALKKFKEKGLIEEVDIAQSDFGRPPRRGYAITESGRAEFRRLLKAAFTKVETSGSTIDAAVHFMGDLSPDQVMELIRERRENFRIFLEELNEKETDHVAQVLQRNKEHKPTNLSPEEEQNWEQTQQLIPFLVDSSLNHQRHLIKAELFWMEEFLADLQTKYGPHAAFQEEIQLED